MHGKCHMGTRYMKAQCPDNTKINLYYLSQASLHCPHLQPSDTEVFHAAFSPGKKFPLKLTLLHVPLILKVLSLLDWNFWERLDLGFL